ncbi:MAG TPA: hypothetical protein VFG95_06335 [Nitrospiria bacterium]|nr:hypothetical protein [Nitrospiria bacterium]
MLISLSAVGLTACGGGGGEGGSLAGTGNITLVAAVSTQNVVPKPTNSSGSDCSLVQASVDNGTIGDGQNGDWPDRYLTPTTFAIGFKGATLLQTTSTVNPVNYTLFDKSGDNGPLVVYLDSKSPQIIFDVFDPIPSGTYDTLQLDVVFYEMIIPAFNGQPGDTDAHCRRIRLYLADSNYPNTLGGNPISALDILFAISDNGFDFNWIDPQSGFLVPHRPAIPYQLPQRQLPPNTATTPDVLTISLSAPISGSSFNFKTKYDITLTYDVSSTFFYDETDTDPGNPNASNTAFSQNFNYLAPRPFPNITVQPSAGFSRDGSLKNACTNTTTCTNSADFWPGLPQIQASVTLK